MAGVEAEIQQQSLGHSPAFSRTYRDGKSPDREVHVAIPGAGAKADLASEAEHPLPPPQCH